MILNSPYITGSLTVTGNIISSGSITISGSIASASYASNAERVDGLDSTSFVFTSSYNTDSASVSTRVTRIEGNYATTGSNVFMGAQTVCANITSTGTIIAQTLNVQQVTSSIVYSSGSNIFGCSLSNTQQFTGSVTMTGSLAVFTAGTSPEFQVVTGGTIKGNITTDVHQVTGSFRVTGSGNHFIVGGNTGIGTFSPAELLHVSGGNIRAESNGNLVFTTLVNTSTGGRQWTLSSAGNANVHSVNSGSFYIRDSTSGANRLVIDTSGNVGIGTTTPTQGKLVVSNSGPSTIYNSETSVGVCSKWVSSDGSVVFFGTDTNHPLQFITNNANVMRITSGGNVGIGTTSPSEALHVYSSGTSPRPALFLETASASGTPEVRLFQTSGRAILMNLQTNGDWSFQNSTNNSSYTERMRITSGGIACFSNAICAGTSMFITAANPNLNFVTNTSVTTTMLQILGASYVGTPPFNCNRIVSLNSSHLSLETGGSTRMLINNAGQIGLEVGTFNLTGAYQNLLSVPVQSQGILSVVSNSGGTYSMWSIVNQAGSTSVSQLRGNNIDINFTGANGVVVQLKSANGATYSDLNWSYFRFT